MDADGALTLVAALATAALLVLGVLAKRDALASVAAAPALVGAVIAVRSATDTEGLARIYVEDELGRSGDEVDALLATLKGYSAAAGVWLVVAGFLLALAAALTAGLFAYRKARLRSRNG
ncbi:hypothetical protein D7294_14625 [Streptomyces hoynatensis]|uniref:Uncharacterized protein n=2 Tax=Streptomyces hoynatensis TaxID=1141874 RepID=A0A3A9Z300_9ACTN|nr:hypothetical protein D7294_14625 [Streptomyces hoynatensis]